MEKEIKKLINTSENIVFFGGAGVSTDSGIPDFRSDTGIYKEQYNYPPETILSNNFFTSNTYDFYNFYRNKMLFLDAKPNKTHEVLADLEKEGKLKAVITQNIDGLHQLAGSKNVLELHGSVYRNYCVKCGKFYDIYEIIKEDDVPCCSCGGIIKPDVVLYGESLDYNVINKSMDFISKADILIVGGTSLGVYPAAGLINYYRGNKLILINKTPTPMDKQADFIFHGNISEILSY